MGSENIGVYMPLLYKRNVGTRVTPVTNDALLDKLRVKRKESPITQPDMNAIITQIEQGFKSHENHDHNR